MLRAARYTCLLLFPALLFSQISNNSVTVTATPSDTGTPQPDQAIFSVIVASGLDKNLSDIVSAVQSSGITSTNFTGFSAPQIFGAISTTLQPVAAPPQIQWNFQLPVPIAKVKETSTALAALAQSIPQDNSGLSLTFTVVGTQVSSQTPACNLSDLLSKAHTQAEQLTTAAGLTVGLIQSISTATPGGCALTVRYALGTVLMPSQPYSITITASRKLSVQPDQITFALVVMADPTSGLDDITAAVQQAGLTGVTFTGVNTTTFYTGTPSPSTTQTFLQWSFALTAPIAKIKDTFNTLVTAQETLAKATPPMTLRFYGGGTRVSPQAVQSLTCPDSDLFKDAQAQAQEIAAAAGVTAGPVLSIGGGNIPAAIPTFGQVTAIQTVTGAFSNFLLGVPGLAPNCAMTVGFLLQQ